MQLHGIAAVLSYADIAVSSAMMSAMVSFAVLCRLRDAVWSWPIPAAKVAVYFASICSCTIVRPASNN